MIIACRSPVKAAKAKEDLLKRHHKDLDRRRKAGIPEREGWLSGLRIEHEGVDLDAVGGKYGILTFCERIREK